LQEAACVLFQPPTTFRFRQNLPRTSIEKRIGIAKGKLRFNLFCCAVTDIAPECLGYFLVTRAVLYTAPHANADKTAWLRHTIHFLQGNQLVGKEL
ncbi:MAG: hypothetical protein KAI41_04575, partial [Hyphomicrobiaceae bacterium]|nr:hypothetical protein [Hyphomicrobiaceae bacterium]